jgi:hypothetical protein
MDHLETDSTTGMLVGRSFFEQDEQATPLHATIDTIRPFRSSAGDMTVSDVQYSEV